MSDTETRVPTETVYAGQRLARDGSLFVVFYLIGSDKDAAFSAPKTVKMLRHAVIGGVYVHTRDKDNETTWYISDKYVRASGNSRVAEWKAAHDAAHVEIRAQKRMEDDKKKVSGSVAEMLVPIRDEYNKTDRLGRLALEVVLLEALRRPAVTITVRGK